MRNYYGSGYYGPPSTHHYLTPGVKLIIIANFVVFGLQVLCELLPASLVSRNFMREYFALSPWKVVNNLWIWQLITSVFLHDIYAGALPWHLIFNMLTLFFFGHMIEQIYGTRRFLVLYLLAGVFASLVYTSLHFIWGTATFAIGASGAIMAILILSAIFHPDVPVYLYFLFPVRLRTLIFILMGFDLFMLVGKNSGGVAASAHLGGALFGYLYYRYSDHVYKYLDRIERQIAEEHHKERRQQHHDMREEVDRLLDKISEHGLSSLTSKERSFLQNASKQYRKEL